jgi:hypothetical protein
MIIHLSQRVGYRFRTVLWKAIMMVSIIEVEGLGLLGPVGTVVE